MASNQTVTGDEASGARAAELSSYTNAEDGVRAFVVVATRGGFHMIVEDLDSGQYLPCVSGYPTFERADDAAKKVVS